MINFNSNKIVTAQKLSETPPKSIRIFNGRSFSSPLDILTGYIRPLLNDKEQRNKLIDTYIEHPIQKKSLKRLVSIVDIIPNRWRDPTQCIFTSNHSN